MELDDFFSQDLKISKVNLIPMNGTVTLVGIDVLGKIGIDTVFIFGNDFTHSPFKAHAISNGIEEATFQRGYRKQTTENLLYPLFQHLKKDPKKADCFTEPKLLLYQKHFNELKRNTKLKIITPDNDPDNAIRGENTNYELFNKEKIGTKIIFNPENKKKFCSSVREKFFSKAQKIIDALENNELKKLFQHRLNKMI